MHTIYVYGPQAFADRWIDPDPKLGQPESAGCPEQFMADCVIADESGFVPARDLYTAYKNWCSATGTRHKTETGFGRALSDAYERATWGGRVLYPGLRLRAPDEVGSPEIRAEPFRPRVGSVVRLLSCSKEMTVWSDCCSDLIECVWFDGSTLKSESFPPECLTHMPHPEEIPF